MSNNSLHKARYNPSDEFYTQLKDIENELQHYEEQFKDKIIFCNCDEDGSNFHNYFQENFTRLGLKGLMICSLDFKSAESTKFLKQADIIVTNPPFSLLHNFIEYLVHHNKQFLIIGNQNSLCNRQIFELIITKKIWYGHNSGGMSFKVPNTDELKKFGNTCWFTNLNTEKIHNDLILTAKYDPNVYEKYDNSEIINVDRVKDIPIDYDGAMGVPLTFMTKYNPKQFEILGLSNTELYFHYGCRTIIGKRRVFQRLIIKHRDRL